MAIDLFCYASQSVEDTQKILDSVIRQHKGLFTERFFICEVLEANFVQKEIAKEYGIVANSGFLIHLNDKSVADLVPTVIFLIKNAFDVCNVIVTSDGGNLR